MQGRHRLHEGEPETVPGRVPARLQPHETAEHALAIGFRNARPLVAHHDPPAAAPVRPRPRHGVRLDDHPARAVPKGVVDEVRYRLEQEVAVADHRERPRPPDERHLPALLLGVGLVELGGVPREGPEVQRGEPFPGGPGLDARDAEKGREGREQSVGFPDRGLHRRGRRPAQPALVAERLQPGAKPGERGLEVVRDVVGDPADPVHELLDAVEHRVELLGELVEVVAGSAGGDPAREVPAHDLPARAVDRIDPAKRAPAHRERPRDREEEGEAEAPCEGEPDAPARPVDLVHVAPDEEQEPAGKRCYPGPREVRGVVRLERRPERELDPAVRGRGSVGPAAHVARERAAPGGREEVDEGTPGAPGDPVVEDPRERREAAPPVAGGEAPQLPIDGRIGFRFQMHRGRPVDEPEDHADRPLEQQEVRHRQAERGAAEVPREGLHASAVSRRGPAAGSRPPARSR